MPIIIRPMQTEDLDQVAEIDRLSFPLPWRKNSFRFEMSNPVSLCRVAEFTGADGTVQVVGAMVTWVIIDEAEVATISVHPQYCRQGIGRMLMDATLQTCKSLDVQRVFLEVRRSNLAAQALYRSYGFEFRDLRPGYYTDNQEDALVMVLEKRPDRDGNLAENSI